jgi:leucyl/phenylalanyl-tRNA--protein transferase
MPVYLLDEELLFPDPQLGREDGLVAMGGDLSPSRLLLAYELGIFPWFSAPDPILWWSPDPRCVLCPKEIKVSNSMRNVLNQHPYKLTFDQDFLGVIKKCQNAKRDDDGTWITDEIIEGYVALHELGIGHSVEVWDGEDLVGGLYGLSLGRMFFGESMFSQKSNASKLALIHLCRQLSEWKFDLIDCQIYNDHLGSLGARNISRDSFLEKLENSLKFDTRKGSWKEA